ncbi:probable steroid-binding protein 3 [Salvia miltiorrhiza]|uniref:probable steroid-binding protein 3 n=1 Tax=Salvia miltiorrhiza TaxID=226208 RepID=UPI0025ACAB22|nr:probable steroid-binding protein 3 [Salvia miltiorrhiza]XP_057810400.1 probable steroid-binding protein 3 [Salvia miltiorrhiza]
MQRTKAHPLNTLTRHQYYTHSLSLNPNFSKGKSMELTPKQLEAYDGSDPSKPIYVAVRGNIYDVTTGKSFYGPGGAYAVFAGKDASRALAKMSKDESDVVPNLDGLTEKEIGVLVDWEKKFQDKYRVVGTVTNN